MNIVTGASGRVGSALVRELNRRGMPTTAIVRNKNNAEMFGDNIHVGIADIFDRDALANAFKGGDTAFLITPENIHSEDVIGDAENVIKNYRAAVEVSGIKRIVGLSSMGAHIGEGSGNLYISYLLERAFADLPVQTTFIRPAYYYSNWLGYLEIAREHGILPTFFKPEQKIAMVAPEDVAQFAAIVIRSQALSAPVYEIEGPKAYSSNDIAKIFGECLNREVIAQQIPEDQWIPTLTGVGFSEDAARNMALMTGTVVNNGIFGEKLEDLIVWNTDMKEYLLHNTL
ncbi:NAD(P)H-binding protein [Dysgonomonas sp. Marseille-P4677]|uniref:NmrA family NAD(P)-binding protein n=1 Tax=Dysgonomonas sp. Marseille-P4677 TaxID=2364790 RepID=UPI00191297B7|nr:NAD(P)H-binding protein [Dysgonomonas sp. Marseille-P4677]MBK5721801.1 NAD(P)H-binding protein [Dysgonomonas sp. Marseille-P4677]